MTDRLKSDVREAVSLSDFGSWMVSEQKRIFLLCRHLLQDPDEADSATQDVFLKAFRALNKQGSSNVEAIESPHKWITRIAVNTCYDRLRSKDWKFWRRRPSGEEGEAILRMTPGLEPDAERQLFAAQIQRRLERAIARLSHRQRVVFALRHYESMTLEEIASTLKLGPGTVKAHLFRATARLREELKDLYVAH